MIRLSNEGYGKIHIVNVKVNGADKPDLVNLASLTIQVEWCKLYPISIQRKYLGFTKKKIITRWFKDGEL
ncbi:hypothetical protein [Cohnella sp. WQ 127256]|uniref:hypothetical protein n=1 Tax=Cohnella sp. WQ 127256 TaxID=2938790 RepID=UPI0021199018|nr:hypothetical protein [Cohnella sp. WQ 127256]